ncbi:MAG: galactose mutarotase [Planctomycetota bacterium]|nr:MAG: galactose mutarotase [Planctomycetota bacterium]
MKLTQSDFGRVEGRSVSLFTLENDNGMTVKLTNYGGIVTSIVIPDARGERGDVVCGFDTLEGYFGDTYRENAPYFGCIVGRYAGRIKDGRFTLGGHTYQLATNDGSNHLHGGIVGFDKKVWDAEPVETEDAVAVRLSLVSPDGDEGYPGRVQVTVEYRLDNTNALSIRYTATTDKATPLSLTNHTYFNLNGFSENILDHTAQIHADIRMVPDETNVPVGETEQVAGTPRDLREPRKLRECFAGLPMGFEDFYIFREPAGTLRVVARFEEETSGRSLEVATTEPGMMFYTSHYMSDDLKREDGTRFGQYRAFCCETSKLLNGPNLPDGPHGVLEPGATYDETTVFRFAWS